MSVDAVGGAEGSDLRHQLPLRVAPKDAAGNTAWKQNGLMDLNVIYIYIYIFFYIYDLTETGSEFFSELFLKTLFQTRMWTHCFN